MLEDGDEELCERYKHILPTLKLMEDLAQILKNKRTLRGRYSSIFLKVI